ASASLCPTLPDNTVDRALRFPSLPMTTPLPHGRTDTPLPRRMDFSASTGRWPVGPVVRYKRARCRRVVGRRAAAAGGGGGLVLVRAARGGLLRRLHAAGAPGAPGRR